MEIAAFLAGIVFLLLGIIGQKIQIGARDVTLVTNEPLRSWQRVVLILIGSIFIFGAVLPALSARMSLSATEPTTTPGSVSRSTVTSELPTAVLPTSILSTLVPPTFVLPTSVPPTPIPVLPSPLPTTLSVPPADCSGTGNIPPLPSAPSDGCVLILEWWIPPTVDSEHCGIVMTRGAPSIAADAIGTWWYVYPNRPDSHLKEFQQKSRECRVEDLR
jgi:hypothetical protein